MQEQPTLFDYTPPPPRRDDLLGDIEARREEYDRLFGDTNKDLFEAFKAYHFANQHIYRLCLQYAREAKRRGKSKYSVWGIINRVRWDVTIETNTDDEFKISNDYIALYARLLVWNHPDEFEGFFTLKAMRPDRRV